MQINLYAVPPAITCGILLVLSGFIFSKRKTSPGSVPLCLFCLSLSWWLFGYSIMYFTSDPTQAIFWARFGCVGVLFIPVFTVHFIMIFLGKFKSLLLYIFYALAIAILPFTWSSLIYRDIEKYYWGFYPVAGPFYWVVLLSFMITFSTGAVLLLRALLTSKNQVDSRYFNQIKFVFIGILIGCFGVVDYVIKYKIIIYPFGYIAAFIFASSIVCAIFRHQLLGIEVVLKKTVIFAGLFGMVMLVLGLVTIATQVLISKQVYVPSKIATSLSFAIGILFYDPTRRWLEKITDRFLFQNRRDIQRSLNEVSKKLTSILEISELARKVLSAFQELMQIESGIILVQRPQTNQLEWIDSFGIEATQKIFIKAEPWIQFCSEHGPIIDFQEENRLNIMVKETLRPLITFKANIVIPLLSQEGLIGLLVLGKKKSDQKYDELELSLLPTLGNELVVAIKNAWLLEEMMREREHKLKLQSQADLVNYAKTIAHEIKNSLVGMKDLSMGIIENYSVELKKIYAALLSGEEAAHLEGRYQHAIDKICEYSHIIHERAERIRVIAKTSEGTLNSSESTREEIYFRILWNEIIRELGDKLRDIQLMVEIPDHFVIYGNLVLLERVFTNLIINSIEAMEQNQTKEIYLKCGYQEIEGVKWSWFEYSDSGPGIPEALAKRIFDQGFSTKAQPEAGRSFSGRGHGLYVCKRIIEELHHGNIEIRKNGHNQLFFYISIPS